MKLLGGIRNFGQFWKKKKQNTSNRKGKGKKGKQKGGRRKQQSGRVTAKGPAKIPKDALTLPGLDGDGPPDLSDLLGRG